MPRQPENPNPNPRPIAATVSVCIWHGWALIRIWILSDEFSQQTSKYIEYVNSVFPREDEGVDGTTPRPFFVFICLIERLSHTDV